MLFGWRQEMCVSQFSSVHSRHEFFCLSLLEGFNSLPGNIHAPVEEDHLMFKMTPEHNVIISHFFSVPQASHHLDMNIFALWLSM